MNICKEEEFCKYDFSRINKLNYIELIICIIIGNQYYYKYFYNN